MAFTVNFYNFAKRENATYRPTGSGTEYSCILKEASSIANPTIQLDIGTAADPTFNYCYIGEFDRYYWITDWTWIKNRLWEATLSTDLLATFKDEIGASSLYVLRSAAAYDGTIIDDYYPVKTTCTTQVSEALSPWITDDTGGENISIEGGVFVVGYVTSQQPNNSHMYGSVVYSAMKQSGLRALVDGLLGNLRLLDPDFTDADASLALQKSLIDPLSYIKSCMWIPVLYEGIEEMELDELHIWDWTVDCPHKIISNDPPYRRYQRNLTIIKHPLTNARGNYMNTAPYTRLNMMFPPFGNIEIDTTLSANATTVNNDIYFDFITGKASDRISVNGILMDIIDSQIGVPIQLSQVSKDYLGAAINGVSAAAGAIGGLMWGDIGGAVSSAGNGIANAVRSMQPRGSSMGSQGSFAGLAQKPRLYHQFMIPVDEDLDHSGRPLCQIRQISTLPGFNMVKDGEIDINGFTGEAEAIRDYLEKGFFYG